MRFVFLCLLAASALSAPALAQVSTNDQALDALKPAAPAGGSPAPAPVPAPRTRPHRPAKVAAHPVKTAPPPNVPAAPPVNPVILPPTFVMPVHPRPLPPPIQVHADAVGAVTPIPGGSRITFGPGSSNLNQATHDAIMAVAAQARANALLQITATAWAPGTPDDPSTPRTLSLDRVLAARSTLINAGIASNRILAVSKGFDGIGDGPPDRMDLVVAAPKETPAGTAAPVPATTKRSAK
jgi:outer membrane protein OmpA-like peptidoglycan-associated protein